MHSWSTLGLVSSERNLVDTGPGQTSPELLQDTIQNGGSCEMDFRSAPQSQVNGSGAAQQNFGRKGLSCPCKRAAWPLSSAPAIEGPRGVTQDPAEALGTLSGLTSTHLLLTGLGIPFKASSVLETLSQAAGPAFSPGQAPG